MKYIVIIISSLFSFSITAQIQHCGYDFTSYLVVNVHEEGKQENIANLSIFIVDQQGNKVINVNNTYSWKNGNQPLQFTQNYTINKKGEKERYFFPHAKDNYFLSVATTFSPENFNLKIVDTKGIYAEQTIPLQVFNMYVLCTNKVKQFGPRANQPIEVILQKR